MILIIWDTEKINYYLLDVDNLLTVTCEYFIKEIKGYTYESVLLILNLFFNKYVKKIKSINALIVKVVLTELY